LQKELIILFMLAGLALIATFIALGMAIKSAAQNKALAEKWPAWLAENSHWLRQEMAQFRQEAAQDRQENRQMLQQMGDNTEKKIEQMRQTVDGQLEKVRQDNQAKLEQMRQTVEEKLQGTLEQKLGESFQLVSQRLEQVYRGLGEMQNLAMGVGDLKKILTNVKTRGIWGEVQLGAILEQLLTLEQYATNVVVVPNSRERVEFAIRLPGQDDSLPQVWLPIDAKFPLADYSRLVDAQEEANIPNIQEAEKNLVIRLKACAKEIRDKYIKPPYTTDFAILFLPTEGLYSQVLNQAGLSETLQEEYRVVIAGPTTLSAILNSLQMGFRTLAIQKRAGEVWQILGTVKTDFSRFGQALEKTQKKLQEASNTIEDAARKSRSIERHLRQVEAVEGLPGNNLVTMEEAEEEAAEETERDE